MKTLLEYCKPEVKSRVLYLHPVALMILCDAIYWCHDHGINAVVSDTVSDLSEDKKLKRTSSSHRDARAWDLSTKGWGIIQKEALMQYLKNKYKGLGAIGAETGEERLIYLHDAGTGEHLHCQIAKHFSMPTRDFTPPTVLG